MEVVSFWCLNSLEKSSDQGGVSNFRDRRYSKKILYPNCYLGDFIALLESLRGSIKIVKSGEWSSEF